MRRDFVTLTKVSQSGALEGRLFPLNLGSLYSEVALLRKIRELEYCQPIPN